MTSTADGPIVGTSEGKIQGTYEGDIAVFRGVPFAAPPVGPLRFKPPVRPSAWEGVRPCVEFGDACPQPGAGRAGKYGVLQPTSEDCLYLNVWTPAADDAKRPVMVFLHGGASIGGSGGVEVYNGARTAAQGTVFVTVNYRLGALGFLHLAELFPGYEGSGSAGVLDAVRALEWVKENVAAFGGDPDNITLMGSSAGAINLTAALSMPKSRGLVRRAAPMSSVTGVYRTPAGATQGTLNILGKLGIAHDDLDAILSIPAADFTSFVSFPHLPAIAVVDGDYLPSAPYEALRGGATDGIDMIVGSTTEESRNGLFVFDGLEPTTQMRPGPYDLAGQLRWSSKSIEEITAVYAESVVANGREATEFNIYSAASSDGMIQGGIRTAESRAGRPGATTYMYRMSWWSPIEGGIFGAYHGVPTPFIFNNPELPTWTSTLGEEPPLELSRLYNKSLVAFATTGDPSIPELPAWPAYELETRATMDWNLEPKIVSDPDSGRRQLWAEAGDQEWLEREPVAP